jgi:hypothetical protein
MASTDATINVGEGPGLVRMADLDDRMRGENANLLALNSI